MKKLKRVLLLGVMALFVPAFVNAASLEFGTKSVSANVATIPVNIVLAEGETATPIQDMYCSVDGYDATDISCEFESNVSNHILAVTGQEKTGDKVTSIKITNHKDRQVNDIVATVKYSSFTMSTNKLDLGAKPVERKLSTNAKLKKVSVDSGKISPSFDPDKKEYTIYDIKDTVKSIIFDYECEDVNCNGVHIDGGVSVTGEQKVELNIGENTVTLTSTAEDGTNQAKYTFTVFRGETAYNSAKLKSLVIGEYELSPKFKPDTYEYTLSIPYSLVTLATAVTYEAEDENATVEIKGHDNLVVGENTISIKVTNVLDTETKEYKIVVTRLNDQDIIVKAYKDGIITFLDANQEKKELTEEEFEKQYPDEWAKIKNKTYEFDEDGNIKVPEESKEEVKEEKKKSKTWLIILLIVLGIIVIGVSGFFIFRKKPEGKDKKNKDKKDESDETKEETKEDNIEVKEVEEEPTEEDDLLNLSDSDEININIRRNPDADLDYDVETEIESVEHTAARRNLDDTVDIDEALSDLMSTRQYNFDDEDEK